MTYVTENGIELNDELLDAMAAEYESGDWIGVGKVSPGRPRAYGEEMDAVSPAAQDAVARSGAADRYPACGQPR